MLFLMLLAPLPAGVQGQDLNATVIGRVLDAETEAAVGDAEVSVAGLEGTQVTDELGQFRIESLRPGAYEIRVQHLGYGLQSDTLVVTAGETVMVEFRVATRPIEIAGISVTARSREVDANLARGTRFDGMTSQEVDRVRTRVSTMGDLVRAARVPGLTVRERADSICIESNRFRRRAQWSPSCHMMQVVVDDVLMVDAVSSIVGMDPQRVDRFEIVPPSEAGVLYGGLGRYGVLRVYTEDGRGPALGLDDHAPIGPRWAVSFSLNANGASTLYNGNVLITPSNESSRSTLYREEVGTAPGFEGSVRWNTGRFGYLGLSAYGSVGSSTATYESARLTVGSFERDYTSFGTDLWFAFSVLYANRWNAQVGLGPSFTWQRVAHSQGGFDRLAAPGAEDPPSVEWSDRSWWAPGGHLFADLTYDFSHTGGVFVGLVFRALATGADIRSWSAQEERDILRSTGNTVDLEYSGNVATSFTLRTGLRWYPGNDPLF